MAVMVPREKWTDERLDDLNVKVDRGFAETKTEMREGFAEVEAEMRAGFAEMRERLDRLQYLLIGSLVAIAAAIVGSNAF